MKVNFNIATARVVDVREDSSYMPNVLTALHDHPMPPDFLDDESAYVFALADAGRNVGALVAGKICPETGSASVQHRVRADNIALEHAFIIKHRQYLRERCAADVSSTALDGPVKANGPQ